MTALAYIVSVLDKHRPSLLKLVDDFPMTQAASKQSYQAMKALLVNLAKYMKTISTSMDKARKLGDQTFIDVIGPFEQDASARLAQLEEQNAQLAVGVDKLCVYLGAVPEDRKAGEKYEPLDKPEEGARARVCGRRVGGEGGQQHNTTHTHTHTHTNTHTHTHTASLRLRLPVFATWWSFIEELRKVYSDYRLAQERAAKQAKKEAAEAEAKAAKAAKAAAAAARTAR
jgi:hypothetical protein